MYTFNANRLEWVTKNKATITTKIIVLLPVEKPFCTLPLFDPSKDLCRLVMDGVLFGFSFRFMGNEVVLAMRLSIFVGISGDGVFSMLMLPLLV